MRDERLIEITDGGTLSAAVRIIQAYDDAHSPAAQIADLERQRGDLQEAANRYLERARNAEAEAEYWKSEAQEVRLKYRMLRRSMMGVYGKPGHAQDAYGYLAALNLNRDYGKFGIPPMTPEQKAAFDAQTADMAGVFERYVATDSPALYLQQFGRAKRPAGWRWRQFKAGFFGALAWPWSGSPQRLAFVLFMFILLAIVARMGWDAAG